MLSAIAWFGIASQIRKFVILFPPTFRAFVFISVLSLYLTIFWRIFSGAYCVVDYLVVTFLRSNDIKPRGELLAIGNFISGIGILVPRVALALWIGTLLYTIAVFFVQPNQSSPAGFLVDAWASIVNWLWL